MDEADHAHPEEHFLFTSESVGEGHTGKNPIHNELCRLYSGKSPSLAIGPVCSISFFIIFANMRKDWRCPHRFDLARPEFM